MDGLVSTGLWFIATIIVTVAVVIVLEKLRK
jgi:hypothetical protein